MHLRAKRACIAWGPNGVASRCRRCPGGTALCAQWKPFLGGLTHGSRRERGSACGARSPVIPIWTGLLGGSAHNPGGRPCMDIPTLRASTICLRHTWRPPPPARKRRQKPRSWHQPRRDAHSIRENFVRTSTCNIDRSDGDPGNPPHPLQTPGTWHIIRLGR